MMLISCWVGASRRKQPGMLSWKLVDPESFHHPSGASDTGSQAEISVSGYITKDISEAKRRAWFMDQYKNPHESKHTVPEVLHWLEETNFKFISSLPKTKPFISIDDSTKLFKPEELGNLMERFFVNIEMIYTGPKEGGFFIIIAKKI